MAKNALEKRKGVAMMRWISKAMAFLLVLGMLQLARLAVFLFCVLEVFGVLVLWPVGFYEGRKHDSYLFLLLPIGATFLVAIQVALWQFMWLRIAQRGDQWRSLAECFSKIVRYPVVRPPHSWE